MPGILAIREDHALADVSASGFASEDQVRDLVATCPGLFAGEPCRSGEPRRWLLVRRAMPSDRRAEPAATEAGGAARGFWSSRATAGCS